MMLAVLGLAILAWVWGRRAYGDRAAFYAALSILTSVGVFLFTLYLHSRSPACAPAGLCSLQFSHCARR